MIDSFGFTGNSITPRNSYWEAGKTVRFPGVEEDRGAGPSQSAIRTTTWDMQSSKHCGIGRAIGGEGCTVVALVGESQRRCLAFWGRVIDYRELPVL